MTARIAGSRNCLAGLVENFTTPNRGIVTVTGYTLGYYMSAADYDGRDGSYIHERGEYEIERR